MKILIHIEYSNGSEITKEYDNVETAMQGLANVEDQTETETPFESKTDEFHRKYDDEMAGERDMEHVIENDLDTKG